MRHLFLLLCLITSLSCRKFVWDNPNDTINPSTQPVSLKDGLVAYFPFDGNANDLSGNNVVLNNFGVVGSRNRKGELNKALFFDGQSYLGGTIQNIPIGNQDRSFSFWARQTRNDNQLEYAVLNYGAQANNQRFCLMYRPDLPNIILYFNDMAPSYSQFASDNTLTIKQVNTPLGSWNHIVVTIKARLISCYINGELIFSAQKDLISTAFSEFRIGKSGEPPFKTEYFYGDIDEFYIYNRALTQEEITYLANN